MNITIHTLYDLCIQKGNLIFFCHKTYLFKMLLIRGNTQRKRQMAEQRMTLNITFVLGYCHESNLIFRITSVSKGTKRYQKIEALSYGYTEKKKGILLGAVLRFMPKRFKHFASPQVIPKLVAAATRVATTKAQTAAIMGYTTNLKEAPHLTIEEERSPLKHLLQSP